MEYEYFRLSTRSRTANSLMPMFRFLSFKNIGCCIIKQAEKKYYLFREGIEATEYGGVSGKEPLGGEVVMIFDPRGVFNES